MDWRRFLVWSIVATFSIGGIALVADALVESDAERIEALADQLTNANPARRLDQLTAWVDTTRTDLTLRRNGHTSRFGESDEDPTSALHEELDELTHGSIELVQRDIRVDGDAAELVLRVRADGELTNLRCEFERDGQRWLVHEVHLFR